MLVQSFKVSTFSKNTLRYFSTSSEVFVPMWPAMASHSSRGYSSRAWQTFWQSLRSQLVKPDSSKTCFSILSSSVKSTNSIPQKQPLYLDSNSFSISCFSRSALWKNRQSCTIQSFLRLVSSEMPIFLPWKILGHRLLSLRLVFWPVLRRPVLVEVSVVIMSRKYSSTFSWASSLFYFAQSTSSNSQRFIVLNSKSAMFILSFIFSLASCCMFIALF